MTGAVNEEDDGQQARLRTLARYCTIFIGVFAVIAALKLTAHIMVPLVLALFLILIAWPFKSWLDERLDARLPKSLSYAGSFIAITLMMVTLIVIVWISALEIAEQQSAYRDGFQQFLTHAKQELSRKGVSTKATMSLDDIRVMAMMLADNFKEGIIIFCLMISYILLAIPEVSSWKTKLTRCISPAHSSHVMNTASEIAISYQKYMAFVVTSGAFNACLTYVLAMMLHLDFPVTWGVVIFLLNFVPTLGPSLMPFLMTAVAFVQFDAGSMMPYVVFIAVSAVQLIVIYVIEPRIPKDETQLSALVVLFSLTFWGYVWGLTGMLLSTPLTMGIVIAFRHFKDTQWMACMLCEAPKDMPTRSNLLDVKKTRRN